MQVVITIVLFISLIMSFGGWLYFHNQTLRLMPGSLPVLTKAETIAGFIFYTLLAILFAWSCWGVYTNQSGINVMGVQYVVVALGLVYAVPAALTDARLYSAVVMRG